MRRIWISALGVLAGSAIVAYGVHWARASGIPQANTLSYTGTLLTFGAPDNNTHSITVNMFSSGTNVCTSTATLTLVNGQFTVPLSASCVTAVQQNANLTTQVVIDGVALGSTNVEAVPFSVVAGTATTAAGVPAGTALPASPSLGTVFYNSSTGILNLFDGTLWHEFLPEDSGKAASCLQLLNDGYTTSGVYTINVGGAPRPVYCDMTNDGGGWMLVYSNGDNWPSPSNCNEIPVTAANIPLIYANGNYVARWYDSVWSLESVNNTSWLGTPWIGQLPLLPGNIGGANVKAWYQSGFTQVRFDFIQGSPSVLATGWCDTTSAPWYWGADNAAVYKCNQTGTLGSGSQICLAGYNNVCDGSGWNNGWTNDLALGNAAWPYAYQSAPNHIAINGAVNGTPNGCAGLAVAGFNETSHTNNATAQNYQVQIWLREP